jgi:2'-5' RNA ligase
MTAGCRDHHATIFLPVEATRWIETARRQWDPVMAARIDAHVTLIYPEEVPDVSLLAERLAAASAAATPFRLRFGGIGRDHSGGVYVHVDDLDGGYQLLRDNILGAPFRPVAFTPHVTIAHPLTSEHRRDFQDEHAVEPPGPAFAVDEVAITGFDGTRWVTLTRYSLGAPRRLGHPRSAPAQRLPGRPNTRHQ